MAGDRYVLLGLALPKSRWFPALAQWTTAARVPGEFLKCLSTEELRARLASGRPYSAVIVDASHPGLDRDLVALARAGEVPVFAVGTPGRGTWPAVELGVTSVLAADFGPDALTDALTAHCRRIGRADVSPLTPPDESFLPWRGRLFAVCGAGGAGASSVAMALAQGYAGSSGTRTLLADCALRADQAMLHDSIEVSPGIQELVEAHRARRPTSDEVRAMTYLVESRRYRLLLGLRQPRFWSTIRPAAFDAALESLRSAFDVVVADIDRDLEGESDGGSLDVQERHHMARAVSARADVVLAVGRCGMKGLHRLVQVLIELMEHHVAPTRILPVFAAAPRHPRARAEAASALAALVAPHHGAGELGGPLFLPERGVDELLRDGVPMPASLVGPLLGGVEAVLERQLDLAPPVVDPELVSPGSLGSWADDDEPARGGFGAE